MKGLIMDVSSAQAAAKRAVEILVELIPEARYAALEGIELSEDGASPRSLRTYKTLILDGATLELKRMEPYHEPA